MPLARPVCKETRTQPVQTVHGASLPQGHVFPPALPRKQFWAANSSRLLGLYSANERIVAGFGSIRNSDHSQSNAQVVMRKAAGSGTPATSATIGNRLIYGLTAQTKMNAVFGSCADQTFPVMRVFRRVREVLKL